MNATERFTWALADPPDPYTDIQLSRFDPATISDMVTYRIRFMDAATLTRAYGLDSDNGGADTCFTTTQLQLVEMMDALAGTPTIKILEVIWYVWAYDSVSTTDSWPPQNDALNRDGFRLRMEKRFGLSVDEIMINSARLQQNYPNPFNPSTTIPVRTGRSGDVRLRVFDLLGEEVAVLHDGFLEAGEHVFTFEGSGLPSGVYSCRLEMAGRMITRSMVLLR